jgi:hypothetical protein
MQDDLSKVAEAIQLGRRTVRIIQTNIAFALGVKAVFLVLALSGHTSLWLAILADTGATLVVIANALTPPRVYRDADGFLVAGNLRGRGIGAHHPGPSHLHAQTMDAAGRILTDTKTAAPYIRHNRHSARESATYTFRLEKLPPAGGRLRIVLHRVPLKKCTGLDSL